LAVTVAGPAFNGALALVLYVIIAFGRGLASSNEALRLGGLFFDQLLWGNVSLVAFYPLSAFPMDGGRALRAFWAMRMDYPPLQRAVKRSKFLSRTSGYGRFSPIISCWPQVVICGLA